MTSTPDTKVALVTGSSSGIGRAIAERLATDGVSVAVHYSKNSQKASEVVESIRARGGKADAFSGDLSKVEDIRSLFQQVTADFGRLDIVVANAGTALVKPLAEVEEEEYDRTFNLNAKGTFFCLQEAARHIADGGRIVSISSGATRRPRAGTSIYCGSKAALEQFSVSLAKELGPRGITVNVVSPGVTETEMLTSVPPSMREQGVQMSALGRLGTPEDIADVVAFLVSDQARWVTGHNLEASGGLG